MSDDQPSRSPIPTFLVIIAVVAGGWYFFRHYQISGLDLVSIREKQSDGSDAEFISYREDDLLDIGGESSTIENPFKENAGQIVTSAPANRPVKHRSLRIASWSLEGFDPKNLADQQVRENMVRILHQFDLVALQNIPARQRTLLPRLIDTINAKEPRYDFVIGKPTGPADRSTTLAMVFDKARLQVDRSQTYTIADPENQMTFDPLVAWFRTVGPSPEAAWTFSMVNVQIDLASAQREVALLAQIMSSVRFDGRGEDDVVLAGLFQADDAYLLPTLGTSQFQAAVMDVTTDIAGKHQVSNLLVDHAATSEYVGKGGVLDFLRVFNLSMDEAKSLSAHLPVYGEFSDHEGEIF